MGLVTADIRGNPYIGVYCQATEGHLFYPIGMGKKTAQRIAEAMDVEVVHALVEGTTLLGVFLCANDHGMVVDAVVGADELANLRKHIPVTVVHEKLNALGNNVLYGNGKAMVHPDLSKKTVAAIGESLDVETVAGTIAGSGNVGAAAVCTKKGLLCHPKSTQSERDALKEFFGLDPVIGTANYGVPLIGAAMVANSKGAATGSKTTGIELNRIEDALGF